VKERTLAAQAAVKDAPMLAERPRNNSSSLRRALSLLAVVAQSGAAGESISLVGLAEQAGMPKSTVARLVEPLVSNGLLEYDAASREYRLGSYTAYLGGIYLSGLDLRSVARPVIEGLGLETGEAVHLVIRDGIEVIYIDKVDSRLPLRIDSRIGLRRPLYSTAVGKSLLAFEDESLLRETIAGGFVAFTERTIVDEKRFEREIAQVRRRGFAVDDGENEAGIRCVGAPIFDQDGRVVAAISVSGPDTRVTRGAVTQIAAVVMASAKAISRRLGHAKER
jgi:IclR family transcriptional regulator, acetate operon repressor